MAPTIAIPSAAHSRNSGDDLRRKNEELETQLKRSLDREERMRAELQSALARLRVAEDAEERLCFQLGELEAEAVDQAREHRARMIDLLEQLSGAEELIVFEHKFSMT